MSQTWEMGDTLGALQCALLTLVGSSDEVLLVDDVDALCALAAKLTRTRVRRASSADVFDAIGEHTRALLVVDPSDAQLELSAFELPMILLLRQTSEAQLAQAPMRIEIRPQPTRCVLHAVGLPLERAQALDHWAQDWNDVKGFSR